MTRFEHLKEILNSAVANQQIGAHGAFWRDLSLDQFKTKRVYGRILVTPGAIETSNLVLALRGAPPFGSDIGTPGATYPRMPVDFVPVPDDDIQFIEQWIMDGCPEDQWNPTAGS
ncbi:hypothetical protein GR211_33460 [Rhizobium leguminosarum]|uniref:hypothetical protein n=1 Tax=Rhizobium ruizarguesonis TaxID=2081791 RepID=UPI0013BD65BA|nr:hypothetical protein [Rhizobium ruizarguesonis]NEJ17757.1 hypothetical protein [Rhizobium ruizarguesonis]NEK31735.1 hypothetical protein [Rhizobium ruizarguesonis]